MVEVYKRDVYKNEKLIKAITTLYFENRCVYGARRMHEILRNRGYRVAYGKVYTVCQSLGYVAISTLTYGLDIKKPEKKYEKVGFNEKNSCKAKIPSTINEVWVCDWTRFFVSWKDELKAIYVYGIMDLYSRRIVSYGVSYNGEDVNVQIEVLKNAIIQRNPLDTLTVHSDNGDSFKDEFYRKVIRTNLNLSQTFNRVEFACGDNSHMESFFATLNKEFYRPSFLKISPSDSLYKYITPRLTVYNFERHLRKYINFYNNQRAHSGIGYLTPRQFESSIRTYVPVPYRRTILHVDINACFAQYEMMMNPSLIGKNLVVIGEEYKRDQIIVCASYSVRKYGIGCGDRLKYAKYKCPDLVVRKSKKKVYEKISKKFFEILYRYTDRVEPYGIDEGWLDVTYSQKLFGSGLNIANLIMADLKKEMGITVSIGISYNKIFSKLASDIHKPDAITQIPYKYYRELVHKLPVEMLLFVGDKTKELFNIYGIRTIGDLAFADRKIVVDVVGVKNASKLIDYANGYEFSAVKLYGDKPAVKSLSRGETTEKNLKTFDELMELIERLCMEVAYKVRNEKMVTNAICVKLRDQKYNDHSMQMQIRNTDNGILMFESIEKLLAYKLYGKVIDNNAENLLSLADYERKLPYEIREVSVIAFKLNKNYENVIDIKEDKLRRIDKVIDKINDKYNSKVIKMARLSEPWYYQYV